MSFALKTSLFFIYLFLFISVFIILSQFADAMSARKVALVTGSNKGIGLAVVRALCKQYDGDVYLTARDAGRGTAAVEGLKAEGLAPLFRQLDINDLESVRAARDFFKAQYGGVDVLINNAGIAFKSKSSDALRTCTARALDAFSPLLFGFIHIFLNNAF